MKHSLPVLAAAVLPLTPLSFAAPPQILSQPFEYRTAAGEFVRLPLNIPNGYSTIQWSKDGVLMPEQTRATLVISDATSRDSGTYTATVRNQDGTTVIKPIRVEVKDAKPPFGTWTVLRPRAVPYAISDLEWIDGRYFAGTFNGTIHLSKDGENWVTAKVPSHRLQSSGSKNGVSSIVSHAGRYHAFSPSNGIQEPVPGGWISEDGLEWKFAATLPSAVTAASNGESLVALHDAQQNGISYSHDGVVWTKAAWNPLNGIPTAVNVIQGAFLVRTSSVPGRIFRSTDGKSWQEILSSLPAGFAMNSSGAPFPEFQGELVNIYGGKVWKTADGIHWAEVAVVPNAAGINILKSINPGRLFSARGKLWFTGTGNSLYGSADLRNWSVTALPSGIGHLSNGVIGPDHLLLARGQGTELNRLVSPDVAPTPIPGSLSQANTRLEAGEGGLVALARLGDSLGSSLSVDGGESWTSFPLALDSSASGNGCYVGRWSGRSYFSHDGIHWAVERTTAIGNEVKFGNGRFVEFDLKYPSFVSSSSQDGLSWSGPASVAIDADYFTFAADRFWAVDSTWEAGSKAGTYQFRYATSVDGGIWKTKSIEFTGAPPAWGTKGILRIGGHLILANSDPSWWLVSDDDGNSWRRLDTGFGYLGAMLTSITTYRGWLVAGCGTGDFIVSQDGREFLRVDAPSGVQALVTEGDALYIGYRQSAATGYLPIVGVQRTGDVSKPEVLTFGLQEGSSPARGTTQEIGVMIGDFQSGDRIEFRLNGAVVHSSGSFYTNYQWLVGNVGMETLVMTVIRTDGSRLTRSWTAGSMPVMETEVRDAQIAGGSRRAFQTESGGVFYQLRADRMLYASGDLKKWTAEIIPGISDVLNPAAAKVQLVSMPDGRRLLGINGDTWISAAGGSSIRGRSFKVDASGKGIRVFRIGSVFQVIEVLGIPDPKLGVVLTFESRLWNSSNGLDWSGGKALPLKGDLSDWASDGGITLLAESPYLSPATFGRVLGKLWSLDGNGDAIAANLPTDFQPAWIRWADGKWLTHGSAGIGTLLLISDNGLDWQEVSPPSANTSLSAAVQGNGMWLVKDGLSWHATADFKTWEKLPAPPDQPLWLKDRWVNRGPVGSGSVDGYESHDLREWKWVSFGWPDQVSTVKTVTDGYLVSTLGKGLFAMNAKGEWQSLTPRTDVNAVIRWKDRWVFAASNGQVGMRQDGAEIWTQLPSQADGKIPVPMDFIDGGNELLLFSQHGWFASSDGKVWETRSENQTLVYSHAIRFGTRLLAAGAVNQVHRSDDGGRTWTPVPLGSENVEYGDSTLLGFSVRNGMAYHIPVANRRYVSGDGISWRLLPFAEKVAFPLPLELSGGLLGYSPNTSTRVWMLTPPKPNTPVQITPPGPSGSQPAYFRGRMVSLTAVGVQVSPLANLTPEIPAQPGHTLRGGETIPVSAFLRNTGLDTAFMDVAVEISWALVGTTGSEIPLGAIQVDGALEVGKARPLMAEFRLPSDLPPDRYRMMVRFNETGGLAVDSISSDNVVISAEALLKVPGNRLSLAASGGGAIWVSGDGEAARRVTTREELELDPDTSLRVVADPGMRFLGWSDSGLGDRQVALAAATAASSITAYFGPVDYAGLIPFPGAPTQDADGDGVPNVIEFLMQSDPLNPANEGWQKLSSQTGARLVEFDERSGVESHRLRVWRSDDLSIWSEVPRDQWIPVTEEAGVKRWRIDITAGKSSFLRWTGEPK